MAVASGGLLPAAPWGGGGVSAFLERLSDEAIVAALAVDFAAMSPGTLRDDLCDALFDEAGGDRATALWVRACELDDARRSA